MSRAQLIELGFSKDMIWRRQHIGGWARVGAGYRLFDMPDAIGRARAACAVLPTAVVSHETAALIHGLRPVSDQVAAVTVSPGSTHEIPHVEVHRADDLAPLDVVRSGGVPVTSPARTVVDLAAGCSLGEMLAVIHNAVDDRLVVHESIREVVERIGRRGKPGIALIRDLLGEPDGDGMTPLERRGAEVLRDGGLDGFETEFPMPWSPARRFDVAFPRARLAVEWDSVRWHGTRTGFDRDRRRDREASLHGWRVLRFTWADLEDPPRVTDEVRRVLAD